MSNVANVLFKKLTAAQFDALSTKQNGTFYRVVKQDNSEDFYVGDKKLNNGQDLLDALYAQYIEYKAAVGATPAQSVKDALDDLYDQIGAGGSVAAQIQEAIEALDTSSDVSIASVSNNVVTIKGSIAESDGIVGAGSASDVTLEEVAYTGAASDVSYSNSTSGLTSTTAQGAIDEIKGGLGTAAAADVATTAIQESSTDDSLVSAAQVATFVATEIADLEGAMHFVGVITRQSGETDAEAIARVVTSPESGDVVVMSDNAKEYIYTGTAWREVGDEGLYVQKSTTIAGVDLQDDITATELRTALNVADGSEANVLESVKVNGTALSIANKAVDVLVAEGSTNGTVSVNNVDISVHGLGSAAYTASTAYDAAGAAADVLGESTDTASDATVYGAKAYADSLASNYDAAGSASTAESNAEDYARGLLVWEEVSA